jgi:NitT/TauT family transport system ATP-binding protein
MAESDGHLTAAATDERGSTAKSRIRVRGIERLFESQGRTVHALGPVDLDIADGEFVCVVGPSGCGKSTLLRIVAGLINPSAGEAVIAHADPARPLAATVFQDHSVFPWKTVAANVEYGLALRRRGGRRERRRKVLALLARLGLAEFADAYPHTLSGGLRQRVAIARALAVEPEILLMDEPFASLDAQLRTLLQQDLLTLWESERRTVVFVTHAIDEALLLGDRVVVMSARPGRIKADIRVPFGRPRSHATRAEPEFGRLTEHIWELLRDEVNAQMKVAPIELAAESRTSEQAS